MDRGLLKCFLLLQTVYPAVYKMGGEDCVADHANALIEAESKSCMGRGNMIGRRQNLSTQGEKAQRDKPKGRKTLGEMHSTPWEESMTGGGVWQRGDNLVVLRFQSPGV